MRIWSGFIVRDDELHGGKNERMSKNTERELVRNKRDGTNKTK